MAPRRFARSAASAIPALAALALLAGAFAPTSTAASELGRPLVRTFTRSDHKAHAQFFAPFQSPEGLMYFGNQLAVMEYDGRTWRVLRVPLPFTRALARGPGGDLYLGDEEQLGVLARPDSGEPRYTSLLDLLPADAKPFGFVRDIRLWRGDLWFATDRSLLRFRERDRSFRAWPLAGDSRPRLFVVHDRLLLHRAGEGLYHVSNDTLAPLSAAPEFAGRTGAAILPADAGRFLVALGQRGLFVLDPAAPGAPLRPFPTEADAILQRSDLAVATRLADGALALGTATEGVVLLDAAGRLLRHLTRDSGLPNASVVSLCEDREGGLWIGTNAGPARVLWRSAATVFDHQTGGIGDARATDLKRHEGTLYYLSHDGLYRLVPSADARIPARFARDERVAVQTKLSSLLSTPGGLLLAGGRGLQRLGPDGLELLTAKPDGLIGLSASKSNPRRVFFAHARGIGTGVFAADGSWRDEGDLAGLEAECYDVVEDASGALWVGTISKGVFRATRPAGRPADADWRTATVTRFTTAAGLPEGHGAIYLSATSLGILFDTAHGIYRLDPASGRFVAFRELSAFAAQPVVLNPLVAGAPGELWTNGLATDIRTKESPYPLVRLRAAANGTFAAENPPPEIQDFFSPQPPHRIVWEPVADPAAPGVLWAKGENGLLRLDLARYRAGRFLPPPLVRSLSAEGREIAIPPGGPGDLRLSYSREPLTLGWVSGLFRQHGSERFQTRLVGFNDTWTQPSARADIAFTNLEGGPFRFEVRSVDRQGTPGPAAAFNFRVAPPPHRTAWAFALYTAAGLGAVAGFVRWRLRAGERERAHLERLVAERTAELRVAKEAADAASRAKSTFLANMSHELRTPLNGVIGYAQVLMQDRDLSGRNRERLRVVQASGEHLLRMINEVLDFSKIEAGRMELQIAPFHLPQLLRDCVAALQPRAVEKQLELLVDAAPDLPDLVLGDAMKLRQVIDNLAGNAIKFTGAGRIRLRVARTAPAAAGSETIEFAVEDTGVGISAADQARLFQPFQQAADGRPPEPGTGLGLAISQRMVELMGGQLRVVSAPGQGSRFHFTLTLPVVAESSAQPETRRRPIVGYRGRRRTLLIVDDIATNRDVLRDLLAPLGFTLAEAAGGAEALAVVPALQPDLVFLDLRMPGIDGLELARRLREREGGSRLRIVAMSASVLSFDRQEAFASGCDDFLPKPFRAEDLLARLGLALHLEWIEEAAPDAVTPPSAPAPAGGLPAAEVAALLEIARRGEIVALRQRLQPFAGVALADRLLALARTYRMQQIRELLERHAAPAAPENSG
jgi:signal transduction histidine kinase/DNA-binding NarL/FixJ family response regulator